MTRNVANLKKSLWKQKRGSAHLQTSLHRTLSLTFPPKPFRFSRIFPMELPRLGCI
jgi:hypothetical protein